MKRKLETLSTDTDLEDLSLQEKRALAWKLIDELKPNKGFSRKKLVPMHIAVVSILGSGGSTEQVRDRIEKAINLPGEDTA